MVLSIPALLGSPFSHLFLFLLVIAASYVVIPIMGWIIVAFGASANNIPGVVILVSIVYLAALIGDISIFFITRRFSKQVLSFMRRFKWFKENEKTSRPLFRKYGFYLILVSRFLNTELCLIMNYIAGFERFEPRKFIIAVVIGEFIYALAYTLFGYIFKDTWIYLLSLTNNFSWIIIAAIISIYLLFKTIKIIRNNGKK